MDTRADLLANLAEPVEAVFVVACSRRRVFDDPMHALGEAREVHTVSFIAQCDEVGEIQLTQELRHVHRPITHNVDTDLAHDAHGEGM